MMQRNCEYCGKPYEAKRSTSRFCGMECRVANNQHPKPEVPSEKPSLVVWAEGELEAAGRLKSIKGQIALTAVERLAGAVRDGAASYASLLREVRACLDDALEGAQVADDPLDELRARRERLLSS